MRSIRGGMDCNSNSKLHRENRSTHAHRRKQRVRETRKKHKLRREQAEMDGRTDGRTVSFIGKFSFVEAMNFFLLYVK
jgi:hypothetical protein